MKTSFKKLTSIVLAVLMLLSVFAVSVSAADTSAESTGATSVYFDPGAADQDSPAWFAWTWDGVTDQWVTGVQDGSYIRFDGCGNKIVFVRMPSGSTAGNWDTCLNQSNDITVSDNLATFSSWDGKKFNVSWSHYDGGGDNPPVTNPSSGGSGDLFLFGTIGKTDFGSGTAEWNQPNQYDITSGTLTTTFTDDAYVGVKKLSTNTWYMTDGFPGMDATSATLYDADKYSFTGTKDKLHVPGGVEVTFTFAENKDGSATLSYTINGEIPTQGSDASTPTHGSEATTPTQGGSGDLFLFGTIGKTDFGSGTAEWNQPNQYDITSGTLTTTFTDDAYVGVKKLSTNTWYMTDGFPGMAATTATLYDADNYEFTGEKDKLHVPGGVEVSFTFTENQDGSATLSYTVNGEIPTQGSESTQSTDSSQPSQPTQATQDTTPSETRKIMFTNSLGWTEVYAHFYNDAGFTTKWPGVKMTEAGENDFHQPQLSVDVDTQATKIIFNNGEGVQTEELALYPGIEGFYLEQNGDEIVAKYWPEDIEIPTGSSEATQSSQATQATQGGSGDLFLFGTIGKTDFGSGATEWNQPNQYDITSGTLTTTFTADAYVGVKKLSTNTWYMTDGFPGMTATTATLYDADKYEFTGEKDKLHVPGGVEVTFSFVENGDGSATLSYTINGEIPTQGSDSSQSTEPTQGGSGDIFLFGTIGTVDFGFDDEWNLPNQYDLTSGTLTTTFTDDAYVGVKKLSTNTWYMTDGFPGLTATSATLYDADKYEFTGTKDKLHVPGGVEVTFTFTENPDGSATLSYTTAETSEPTQYTEETQASSETQSSSETQATQQSSETQQTQQTQATYAPPNINTVYFINTPNWTTVKCYAFTGADEMGSFPGSDMIKTSYKMGGYDVYGFTLDTANYTKVIFNDGFNQTATLDVQPGKCYKPDTHNWVELNPDVETQPTQASSETQATTPTQASSETQATTPTQASSETQATTPTQASSETQAPATKITLTCDNPSIYVGDITVVNANVENPVGQTTFFSGSPTIASVSSLGIVQGLAAGQAYIFATNNGVTASILITVSEKPTQATQPTQVTQPTQPTQVTQATQTPTQAPETVITISCSKTTIYVNESTIVGATVTNGVGATTFKSSNTKVATVSAAGKVTGKKAGSVTITATNNGKTASVKIKVAQRANPMTVKAKTVKAYANKKTVIKKTKAFTIKKAKGTVTFKKVKGDKKITINKKTGKITVKKGLKKNKTYQFKVKVTAKGNTAYKAKSKTVTVTIKT